MKSNEEKQFSTETTSLLNLPSPHSTDRPVQLDHILSSDNLENGDEYHGQRESKRIEDEKASFNKKFNSNGGLRRVVLLLVFACIAAVFIFALIHFKSGDQNNSGSPGNAFGKPQPFSLNHPNDLGITSVARPKETAPPERLFRRLESPDSDQRQPLPTSSWYQNLLLTTGEPNNLHRAYALPYMLDLVGPIPGLTLHKGFLVPTDRVIQLADNAWNGLTLGAAADIHEKAQKKLTHQYTVSSPTELGVTLHWDAMNMSSSIVRGMAYGTMIFEDFKTNGGEDGILFPTLASYIAFGKPPVVDGTSQLECDDKGSRTLVEKEVELHFGGSDFTWLVFFSQPVWVQCSNSKESNNAFLQVVDVADELSTEPLVVRAALANSCTNGRVHNYCKSQLMDSEQQKGYGDLLRRYADTIPGENTSMKYQVLEGESEGTLVLDWDARSISSGKSKDSSSTDLGMIHFAMPHHMDALDSSSLPDDKYCLPTIMGPACAVLGTEMTLTETIPDVDFRAKRPIPASFLSDIGDTLVKDMKYELEAFFQRGAGDTYFSGKMLSKLGRIALVAEEVTELCSKRMSREYDVACKNTTIPTKQAMDTTIDKLESSVEIWINGSAETPFIYDDAWGGLVSCGCYFNGKTCDNEVPNCPTLSDQGLDFGNGFYNDQHFHYGYHIYAAAIVAHFRPEWGKKHWEEVLLLVRSIANPSRDDTAFPLYRHKDWYQGSSWASGVPRPPYLNGKNQESSSEAIAAYESVALFGKVMQKIWTSDRNPSKAAIAKEVKQVGQLMTATELRSVNKYWHVQQSDPIEKRIYPVEYTGSVVGIVWQSMIQFGTWFGTAEYLPYGIQLLPLTPISEERDELEWMNEMYYPFSTSCASTFQCTESGWSVLQLAVLATVGYREEASIRAIALPEESYTNAGGNGHSRTNTLWYIATRPIVDEPIELVASDVRGAGEKRPAPVFELTDCHTPATCTDAVLDNMPDSYSCREHITFLIKMERKPQWDACTSVGVEHEESCGLCNPTEMVENTPKNATQAPTIDNSICPPCTDEECDSDLNRCPLFERSFVCTAGANVFGCSPIPWYFEDECDTCCEMTRCQNLKDIEAQKVTHDGTAFDKPICPPCPKEVCYGEVNQCPIHTAPYLCLGGDNVGGCASHPWDVKKGVTCSECCEVKTNC